MNTKNNTKEALHTVAEGIKALKADLERIQKADDPEDFAKHFTNMQEQERIQKQIDALQKAQSNQAVTEMKYEKEISFPILEECIAAKAKEIAKVQNALRDSQDKLKKIEADLQAKVEAGDIESAVKLTEDRENEAKQISYLMQVQQKKEAVPDYKLEDIMKQWAAICDDYSSIFKSEYEQLVILAAAYNEALKTLATTIDKLRDSRSKLAYKAEIRNYGNPNFAPCFTQEINVEAIKPDENAFKVIANSKHPLMGSPL